MKRILTSLAVGALVISMAACGGQGAGEAEAEAEATFAEGENVLNIYSSRHYDVDQIVYDKFEEETGITVQVVEGKSGELVERILREKNQPAADVFLTVGAESIWQLENDEKLLGEINSEVVNTNIPENYRGEGWMAIASRARVIAYAKDRVDPTAISTYQDLLDPQWEGKILVRSSESSYNQALVASFIALWGEDEAKAWAQGVTDNMAREPKGNDIDQAKAIAAGEGDIAIMNSYYYARMLNSTDPEVVKVTEDVGLIFPEETHLNISYAAWLAGASHSENAMKFLEFLSRDDVQRIYAEENGEFPINPNVELTEVQASWGEFNTQDLDYNTLGENLPKATLIFDEVGWK